MLYNTEKRQKYDFNHEYQRQNWQKSAETELNSDQYGDFGNLINNLLNCIGLSLGYKTFKGQTFFYDGIQESLNGFNYLGSEDIEGSVSLTFSEAFNGIKKLLLLDKEIIEAHIPRGAKTGSCLKIKQKGKVSSFSEKRGDLYLNIELEPHPLFEFEGEDLVAEIPIAPEEAVLGAVIQVPTPDGKVNLKIPSQTNSGQYLRLKKKGWYQEANQQRSDLIVKFKIVIPDNISNIEQKYYRKIREFSNFNPRQSLNYKRF
ncbi:MAG: J domain-containing protein [Xenococcaceae cyanobacterium MO_167.B52]|nr:J domain-containing protein [Xenococcaceae cyanobacterium MO_167.B52]